MALKLMYDGRMLHERRLYAGHLDAAEHGVCRLDVADNLRHMFFEKMPEPAYGVPRMENVKDIADII